MLGHALDILKTKQVKYVLMTCNPKNFSSQKVILYYGGYEIEPYIKKNGHLLNGTIFQLINYMQKTFPKIGECVSSKVKLNSFVYLNKIAEMVKTLV